MRPKIVNISHLKFFLLVILVIYFVLSENSVTYGETLYTIGPAYGQIADMNSQSSENVNKEGTFRGVDISRLRLGGHLGLLYYISSGINKVEAHDDFSNRDVSYTMLEAELRIGFLWFFNIGCGRTYIYDRDD